MKAYGVDELQIELFLIHKEKSNKMQQCI